MAAVSQALVEFANHYRAQPAPGVEVIVTPRYQITLTPDFPIPGPNNVSWIRCRPDEAGPILAGLGFETVGWRRFYLDTSTA